MQLIDTHVHINFEVFKQDLDLLQSRWQKAGVVHLIHSCVEPNEFKGIQSLADRFRDELSLSIGLHPLDAHKWTVTTGEEILATARSDPRVVAIGEIGLDFYKANNQDWQKQVLEAQLAIAHQLDKPVIIHCRNAAADLREILESFSSNQGPLQGVIHCWSGTPEETKWFLDLGFYISFSGIVTFKNAVQLQESVLVVPSNRLLVETDCPFLAPVPKRGKRNEPSYVRYVAEFLAQWRRVSLESLAQRTTQNACQLFQLSIAH
ncbi:TatD family hydrolase [Cyanobacterium sp. uoEpiScrs1]|uniref:TatD family hydrolase n=1 Tax=Cyanobacterium sp. uoEpiScrs1 TaxID=2976343 RepID=UPI00226981AA|nr:TatD family hydrolase [Cyanobacterium sp. uoEpiScrs1]